MQSKLLGTLRNRTRPLAPIVEDGPAPKNNDPISGVASWKRPALIGYIVIILTFGVMGTWSAFARLDRAVVAPGTVNIESSRKTVQHLEGGIVNDIRVKEGQDVKEGDVLLRLAPTQAKANADLVRNQLEAAEVLEARPSAELNTRSEITLPPEIEVRRKQSTELAKEV